MAASLIAPNWPAPEMVRAFSTTRAGGYSRPPYNQFNLGDHVGDSSEAVAFNRAQLQKRLGSELEFYWLQQVHGVRVVELDGRAVSGEADAAVTGQVNQVCQVMTADCLPVLFCNHKGTRVAAAHAGWRGLCAGVLEATIEAMNEPADQLMAWLGPAIGPKIFQVGDEVRQAFMQQQPSVEGCFRTDPQALDKWLADIYQLARLRLQGVGLKSIYGGTECTFSQPQRYFSYRRDGMTGRMATGIWIAPQTTVF